jgi:uncharacterized protein (TIGR00369 family)
MPSNDEVVRSLIVASPFAALLGMRVESVEPDRVRVRLPFRPDIVTLGDVVHGGAISSLIDTSATAAVWTGVDLAKNPRGTTVGFTVSFLAAGRGQDLVAAARVIQRGRTISVCQVEVTDTAGSPVAAALVTYKLG